MTYQYTPSAWAGRLTLLNAQYGTTYTTAQLPVGVVNVVLQAGQSDAELTRVAQYTFANLIDLRSRLYSANSADAAVPYITTFLGAMTGRWPDDLPAVPSVTGS